MKTTNKLIAALLCSIVIPLALAACVQNAAATTPPPGTAAVTAPSPSPMVKVEAGAPDVIGLYLQKGSRQDLLVDYKAQWTKGKDIATFHAFASDDEAVYGSTRGIFQACWKRFPGSGQYRVGYTLGFTLASSQTVELTIRGPEDAPKDKTKFFYQYVEVYLYDAVHQLGRHSHLDELGKDTLLTSIKLTAGTKIADVESIRLTAFVYRDDSFFDSATGRYIGDVSYEIPIFNEK